MPELPEVETVMRGLAPVLSCARIVRVEQNRADLRFPFPPDFVQRLEGQKVGRLGRRAKYLLVPLHSGETLVIHLGMSGRMTVHRPDKTPPPDKAPSDESPPASLPNPAHDHVVLHLHDGTLIRYNDPRRFGFMTLVEKGQMAHHKLFATLGPEPLGDDFHANYLARMARGRRTALKNLLLNQKIVAGLGNIYVCEALFRARLSPQRQSLTLTRQNGQPTRAAERLVTAIRQVLQEAIRQGGSTLRDHRLTDGSLGYFQHSFAVYGRENEACRTPHCKGRIRRIIQTGRSTFHCPQCQR